MNRHSAVVLSLILRRMKDVRFLGVGLIILLLPSHALVAQPKITIAGGTAIDFGRLEQGEKISKIVSVINNGPSALVISDISVSCGCTTPKLSSNIIPPGDSARLSIVFDSKLEHGKVNQHIILVTNDSAQRNVFIYLTADVGELLRVQPEVLNLGLVLVSQMQWDSVRVINSSRKSIDFLNIYDPDSLLIVTVSRRQLSPGDTLFIRVSVTVPHVNVYQGALVVKTNYPPRPLLRVPYAVQGIGK